MNVARLVSFKRILVSLPRLPPNCPHTFPSLNHVLLVPPVSPTPIPSSQSVGDEHVLHIGPLPSVAQRITFHGNILAVACRDGKVLSWRCVVDADPDTPPQAVLVSSAATPSSSSSSFASARTAATPNAGITSLAWLQVGPSEGGDGGGGGPSAIITGRCNGSLSAWEVRTNTCHTTASTLHSIHTTHTSFSSHATAHARRIHIIYSWHARERTRALTQLYAARTFGSRV